jgi:acetyl-CoA C-acetyltransferase
MTRSKVFIVSATRSAIGAFGGALVDVAPADLGACIARASLEHAGCGKDSIVDEVIIGNVLGAGHGMNMARQVALKAGVSVATPAYTVNQVCGSGLKAVMQAASSIRAGESHTVLAGGVESMSQAGFVSMSTRWGARLGSSELKDLMLSDGLTDVFHQCHMGITAENLATRYSISREAQDAFACESQKKAAAAQTQGFFKSEISAVSLMKRGKQVGSFELDEHLRPQTTLESLKQLKPAFSKEGSVTAGNASGINDGAAFLVLMSEAEVLKRGLTPLAEVVAWGSGGVEPEVMGIGPVPAVRQALQRAEINLSQLDLIEANEAFAVQALAVARELELPLDRTNVCGGAIALGHPIGASGARVLVTLLHQLKRTGGSLGLATLCVGGGQGVAVIVKNIR